MHKKTSLIILGFEIFGSKFIDSSNAIIFGTFIIVLDILFDNYLFNCSYVLVYYNYINVYIIYSMAQY